MYINYAVSKFIFSICYRIMKKFYDLSLSLFYVHKYCCDYKINLHEKIVGISLIN